MKDKYKYHVTYAYKAGEGTGIGSRIFTLNKKITSSKQLRLVEGFIAADGHKNPVILNFILLDTKWGFWEWLYTIAELVLLALCVLAMIASFLG